MQSKVSREAMEAFDASKTQDTIPGADQGGHERSHGAHLHPDPSKIHLVPESIGKQGRQEGTLRQPPQDPSRNSKESRRS